MHACSGSSAHYRREARLGIFEGPWLTEAVVGFQRKELRAIMGRRGNYIGGGTIIGSSGSWPTLDPAASSSEMIRGKKEYKPSQQGKRHKRHGRVVQRSKEQRSKHLKEIFATNDI